MHESDRKLQREKIYININDLITALAAAFDLAEKVDRNHSMRTTYIASRIADNIGLASEEKRDIFFASLLHDIAPVGELFNENIVFDIVNMLPVGKKVAYYVSSLWKHKKYDSFSLRNAVNMPLGVQLIYIAELMEREYLYWWDKSPKRKIIKEWVVNTVKRDFPVIADTLIDLMKTEAFWLDMNNERIKAVINKIAPLSHKYINIDEMEMVARAFTTIIDRKNSYTGNHSLRVGDIAYETAIIYGYGEFRSKEIKIAGYLHDLGKLAVPEVILNKAGVLDESEFEIIKSHPYYTYTILGQIRGMEDIARWAGNHHERLDGSGYPWCKQKLDMIDQIIAVSDIVEALTAVRPYRGSMEYTHAIRILKKMVLVGQISAEAVEVLDEAIRRNPWLLCHPQHVQQVHI